jgi:hypothetical protein
MRRREKFVIASILLSLGLLATQYINLDWRYYAIGLLFVLSYVISAWALWEDLQPHEWLTIVPFPAMYAASVSLFYFLLPEVFWSRLVILFIFGLGMYALFLTSNIFSVAKGRTIQLLYAAHATSLFFTLITSLLFTNAIFSLKLPFYGNAILVAVSHFPLILMSLWVIELKNGISKDLLTYTGIFTLVLAEFALLFSFLPIPLWYSSLYVMSLMYIGLSILQNFLRGRLFRNTLNEYVLVSIFMVLAFILTFPGK